LKHIPLNLPSNILMQRFGLIGTTNHRTDWLEVES
jgi:hypothetical protein